MRNKKGAEKYYFLVSLILAILIMAIGLYFLFHEFFTEEDIDWEVCRQSIVIRSGKIKSGLKWAQESSFPFRCRTQVIGIKKGTTEEEAKKLIADTMASCHYLYGEGETPLYGDESWWKSIYDKAYMIYEKSVKEGEISLDVFKKTKPAMCFVCARIHFDEDLDETWILKIGDYIVDKKYSQTKSYFDYLYGDYVSEEKKTELVKKVRENFKYGSRDGDVFIVSRYIPSIHKPTILATLAGPIAEEIDRALTEAKKPALLTEPWQDVDDFTKQCIKVETIPA